MFKQKILKYALTNYCYTFIIYIYTTKWSIRREILIKVFENIYLKHFKLLKNNIL